MEEKQWIGMGLAIMGGTILGAFRYIGAIPRKCKAFKCRVAVRSALTFSRFINNLLSYIQDGIRILIY